MQRRWIAPLISVMLLSGGCRHTNIPAPTLPTLPRSLVGDYRCAGRNNRGEPYQTTLAVVASGQSYQLVWRIEGVGSVMHGLAIPMGDVLAVALVANGTLGIAAYRMTPGTLEGIWTGGQAILPEICVMGDPV